MAQHIHKCSSCARYTLERVCSSCGSDTILPKPPKFSLNDKYVKYRREIRKKELTDKGLL